MHRLRKFQSRRLVEVPGNHEVSRNVELDMDRASVGRTLLLGALCVLALSLAACSSTPPMGTVTGRIVQVGGIERGASAVRGVVTLTNVSTGVQYHADSKGKAGYSIEVPVGTYTVTGRGHGGLAATARQTVHVRQSKTSRVNLIIPIV